MTDAAIAAAEKSVASMIGASFSGAGAPSAPAPEAVVASEEERVTFSSEEDFDADFQDRAAALACRDAEFLRRTGHLIKPEYFEDVGNAGIVNLVLKYWKKYGTIPDAVILNTLVVEAIKTKQVGKAEAPLLVGACKKVKITSLAGREYIEERVTEFAKHQAMSQAILASVPLIGQKRFDKIETMISTAAAVGVNEDGDEYDYYARIEERTKTRLDAASGLLPPQGITTGIRKLDELLYHRGWGRKELTSIMGGAKAGKTTALINFAKNASLAGYNVLYATLEVGANIISDRLDASNTETLMKELGTKIHAVREKIEELAKNAGVLKIREFPSGTLSPNQLRAVIERYKSPGWNKDGTVRPPIKFDLIVVDYADIMAPNFRTSDTIENSKSIYVDLRAIAHEEDAAVLTATQTNREGFKSAVAKAEHVAEDFNKVRTVDLMISINKTEEEAARDEARLYFAASRNQESGFTVVIKQNIAAMQFLTSVLRIE